jgi:hypothetical protein
MAVSVVFSWKLGEDQIPKKIVSASMLEVARYLPLSRSVRAVTASTSVIEKVD